MTEKLLESGVKAFSAALGHVEKLSNVLDQFKGKRSELRKQFKKDLAADAKFQNGELNNLKDTVEDTTDETIELLNDLNVWMLLLIPKVDSGGNFDVKIQLEFVKKIGQSIKDIEVISGKIATYHDKRSGLIDKMSASISTVTTKKNVLKTSEENGKTGESETTTETRTEKELHIEQYEALASLDLDLYVTLKANVRLQRDFLVVLNDFAVKNEKKLKKPKNLRDAMPGFFS